MDPLDGHLNRRRFLKRTSLGAAGLVVAAGFSCAFAADNADLNPIVESENQSDFVPVRYRPMPAKVAGLKKNFGSLNGAWLINPNPDQGVRENPLSAAGWSRFNVPGQWAQQGYDIPLDKTVAVAREFTIPRNWNAYRIFLRFDSIHAGTNYWLNGKALGYSENLFTPVEWEITEIARAGEANRLDLEMKVATASERLSSSCVYTGYSLGGIDRAVRIYALPKLHIATLRLNAGLDQAYRDGKMQIELGIDNADPGIQTGLAVSLQLFDKDGRPVAHSSPGVNLDPLKPGLTTVRFESQVTNPLKWNAEQPNLYKLALILEQDGRSLERIERNVGFRTVETKDRQLYVNGARVKLAAVCHHEIDPLTGRANTMRHAELDVKRFKSANLNHIRTSHYPCTQEFLDAADRYGLYVELEAPLCWVAPAKDLSDLKAVLTPTSAMIDYNHSHPSVIIWSLANESHWSGLFEESNKLCKRLDPTRPTTIEHVFSNEDKVTCDIISRHYQQMPYDNILKDDPRPFLHGECFFLVYHEQTDVAIDPGLRQLWAAGNADPKSEWGRRCLENVKNIKALVPGIYPGAWSYIYASEHCIGSTIWSGIDDIAFLPNGKVVSSENGNAYWGLIDGWRRPKPELALAKFVFSPVWFPRRQLDYTPGQPSVRVAVENRHSFTNLTQFDFIWELHGASGKARIDVPPGSTGEIEIPVSRGTPQGEVLLVRVIDRDSEVVNATLMLGESNPLPLPEPQAGAPKSTDDGRLIFIEGTRFTLVLDKRTGDFDSSNARHHAPIIQFPSLHVTRHDFGDLDRKKPPYAEFPDVTTRVIEAVTVNKNPDGLELIVTDRYKDFSGAVRWLMDKEGAGNVSFDYTYTGDDVDSREIGLKAMLSPQCDKIKWRRWSEWGLFPEDCICRTEGTARARRNKNPKQPANIEPHWPWSQDENEWGTVDFRSIKFCIYNASLMASNGSGVGVVANGDVHFRACLAAQGVKMHILSQCPLAPVILKNGARLAGDFSIRLLS
ncbi:MAG TPA: glycoside hydrolase family 2 TIM barrel-domain containing protein [Alphaproteobacteria bacterium]|nr:glycoside hydrolase family 2 TIM barrel-domain containing protein [Alphaproteobacteria bacterium]